MRRVHPKVFLIGESCLYPNGTAHAPGLNDYLEHVGTKWRLPNGLDGTQGLIEVMGRLCYRSWEPGLNPNVTKVREGNDVYIGHILEVKHGSVIEHPVTHWIFADVSRVFTHELVRHRAGAAYSQESLRYVRLTDLGLWLPLEMEQDPAVVAMFEQTFKSLEDVQLKLAEILKLDSGGFSRKKVLTSAMRRAAPIGLATAIGATFNHRALRHIIEMRTAEGAEAEIRYVFDKVAVICTMRWPNIYQDFVRGPLGAWVPQHSKV